MQNTKTFRLFISSTFNDFRREREVLQTEVFPHIKEYCSKKGYVFQPIDLRWGINEEAQLDQKTLELCLDEVRSCKAYPYPNFLVMLGDRYGWVPLPYAIESKEFEEIVTHVVDNEKKLLLKWYREDLNQLPASYILKERTGEYADFRAWGEVEESIRVILQTTVKQTSLTEEQQRKYFISATEAEIEEGIIPYINSTAYQRKLLKDNPELEKIDPEHIFGFFRELDDDIDEESMFVGYDVNSARELKSRVKLELPSKNILSAYTHRIDNVHLDEQYIDEFKCKIILFLKEKVNEQSELERKFSPLDIELSSQDYFVKNKRLNFVGQEALRDDVKLYLANNDRNPFVIYGESGQGKSSLMAKLIEECELEESREVYFRFVGATAYSSTIKEIFLSLFEEMNIDSSNIIDEEDFEKFSYKVEDKILEIKESIVIFIDAVDQLGHEDQFLWLPETLPNNVKIILSALEDKKYKNDSKYFDVLRTKTGNIHNILPFNTMNHLLYTLLKEENRTVQRHQEKYFLKQGKNVSSPLYTKVAIEEMKHWKSFDGVDTIDSAKDIKLQDLANTQKGIIEEFILNLHIFYHHDEELVRRVLGYIYASSTGLSESEIIQLLSADKKFVATVAPNTFHENKENTLPMVLWTRLYMGIKSFLSLKREGKEEVFYFFHREFESVISEDSRQKRVHYQFIKDIQYIILKSARKTVYTYSRWGSLHITAIVEYILRYMQKKEIENEMNFILSLDEGWILAYLKELNTLGSKKSSNHKIKASIICFEYAIYIGRKYKSDNSGDGLLEYLKTLEKLSTIYWNLSRADEAILLKKEYLSLAEKLYYIDSENSKYAEIYAKAMYQLSVPYKAIGRFKDERKLREKTFQICRVLYEKDSTRWSNFYANSLINLAASYKRGRRYKDAIKLGEEAIVLRTKLYACDPNKWANKYAQSFQETALIYAAIGNTDTAIKYVEKSISIREKLFYENPRKYIVGYTIGLSNLSIYYRKIKNYSKALELENRCFEIRKEYYDENPDRWSGYFAGIHVQLGRTYRAMKKLDIAISYLEKAVKIRKYIYDKAPDRWAQNYSTALSTLANTYRQDKQYIKALEVEDKALKIRKKLYAQYKGNRASGYVISLHSMAKIYIEIGDKTKAYKYAYENYEIRKKYSKEFKTTTWKKYYAASLNILSKTLEDINEQILLLEESVYLRNEIYKKKGEKFIGFYKEGLTDLIELYVSNNMLEESILIQKKLDKLK